jgi:hypothetical protein
MICLLVLSLAFSGVALADARMPLMPAPPTTPVYWQLTRITLEPSVAPAYGYDVRYETAHLPLDLSDPLMLETQLADEAADLSPEITLTIEKNGEAMAHTYRFTALPVYLEPNTAYPVSLTAEGTTPAYAVNSLLGVYMQGEPIARISAGAYTDHPAAAEWVIDTAKAPFYIDGSLVLSFVLRDVNDMFRLRVEYIYEMAGGAKPVPTPVPGFVAVPVEPGVVPSYYIAVPGRDDLWTITTAPDQVRAYGVMTGEGPNFFPADVHGAVRMDEPPVTPEADYARYVEGFVPWTPETVPAVYRDLGDGTYGLITRDGETLLRAYGRIDGGAPAFYPIESITTGEGTPVDPAADYETYVRGFGAAAVDALPTHYRIESDNLYAFTARDEQVLYRVYGRLDGAEPAYYAADAQGNVTDPAPVDPEADFIAYIKGFTAKTPDAIPDFYAQAGDAYVLTDRAGAPLYRAYGVKDGAAPAWYPADAAGQVAEDAAPLRPEDDFTAYIAGFEPIAMPDAPYYYELTEQEHLFSFIDLSGAVQYRAYGSLNRGEPAYYPADAQGQVAVDALPVEPAADLMSMPAPAFRAQVPPAELLPAFYAPVSEITGLYTLDDREGNPLYRIYGGYGRQTPAFYPATAQGEPIADATPVTGADDYTAYVEGFAPAVPAVVPSYYQEVDAQAGLYAFDGRNWETLYRVYGAVDRGEPAFYPSDAAGVPTALVPVNPDDEIALLPTPYARSVITLAPAEPTPESVTREGAQPQSTDYAAQVQAQPTDTKTLAPVSRDVALPQNTAYAAQVQPGTPDGATAAPITRQAEGGASDASREASAQVSVEATELTVPPIASPQAAESPVPVVTAEFPAPTETTLTESIVTAEPTNTAQATITAQTTAAAEATDLEKGTTAPSETPTEGATITGAPTAAVTESPTAAPEPEEAAGNATGWIAGGIAALAVLGGGGFAVYKKRKG